jgi:hypothetical protein
LAVDDILKKPDWAYLSSHVSLSSTVIPGVYFAAIIFKGKINFII